MRKFFTKAGIGFFLTLLISLAFIIFIYWDIVLSPNEYLLAVKNDAFSNYFSFLFHIRHDTSFLNFTGMNYPYGEHIPFVDCQPALSNTLQWFSNYIADVSPWSVGIMNTLLLFSVIFSSLFLYLILIHFNVDFFVAVFASIGISLLSSQPLLWEFGHFGLAYTWFFPAGWYFLIRYFKSDRKYIWSVLISIHMIFWFYIHNYLGFILLLFTLLFHVLHLLKNYRTESKKIRNYIFIFLQVFIPLSIVYYISFGLDPHEGRIEMPFSTEHRATWQMIFLPNKSFLRPLYELFYNFTAAPTLTWIKIGNYIGFVSNVAAFLALILLIVWIIKRKYDTIQKMFPAELNLFLLAAVCFLFYAMLFPFQVIYDWVFDFVPKMKQFVAIGRFAWVFYYIFSVYAICFLWNLMKNIRFGKWLLLALTFLTIGEGWSNHYYLFETTGLAPNIFEYPEKDFQTDEITKLIKTGKYQAIVPLPFHHQYNTPGGFFGTDKSDIFSMQLSYATGIPLMSAYISRPSISEGRNITEIFSPSYYFKKVQNDFHNKKPLLILYTKEELRNCENTLLKKSIVIMDHPNYILAELPFDSLFTTTENSKKGKEYEGRKANLFHYKNSEFLVSDSINTIIIYENFDTNKSPKSFKGKGAYSAEKIKRNIIFQTKPGSLLPTVDYSLSFWYYSNLYDQSFVAFRLKEFNASGKAVDSVFFDPMDSYINDNSWYFTDLRFTIKSKQNTISIIAQGKPYYDKFFYLDELLLRPVKIDVYKVKEVEKGTNILFKNNEYIRLYD